MFRALRIEGTGETVFDPPLRSWIIDNQGTDATLVLNQEAEFLLGAGGAISDGPNGEPLRSVRVTGTTIDVRIMGGTLAV